MNPLRQLPAVHAVLSVEPLRSQASGFAAEALTFAVRQILDELRQQLLAGHTPPFSPEIIAQEALSRLQASALPRLRPVINATGIILHTNLGRSPLSEEAARAAYEAGRGYLNLELDLETGNRSSRQNPIREILQQLTGVESATVVNNCAAATVIVLRALAFGREVIVSRGQLIEIGGSFRIPEIMAVSGAKLREVGTTNITRIRDYENAIGPETALLMRIHSSNFRIRGFTEAATLEELVELGRKWNLPVIDDLGSGAMIDYTRFGLGGDPLIPESLAAKADVLLFSGDKLLGGPQAGLILGRKQWIDKIERDPLMRAFRCDKMTLAALEATLRHYQNPEAAVRSIPTLRMTALTAAEIRGRAEALLPQIRQIPGLRSVELLEECGFIGGGSLPDVPLATTVVAIIPELGSENDFAEALRMGTPAVMPRIRNSQVLFDLRTVFPEQEGELLRAMEAAVRNAGGNFPK